MADVILEPHGKSHPGGGKAPIINEATLMMHGPNPNHKQQQVPVSPTVVGLFLQLQCCCLCHRELTEGMDIYMYRGDWSFCSEECWCRHIFMDEDAGNGAVAATVRGRAASHLPNAARINTVGVDVGVGVGGPDLHGWEWEQNETSSILQESIV